MTVSDLMREDVVTARPDESVGDVAKRMEKENVGSVVIERNGRPEGIVTDRDLTTRVLANGGTADGWSAEDAMTRELRTVRTDTGVMELCNELGDACVRRMPVVDDDGNLAGIVTHDDLNTLLADEQRELAQVIQAESPAY
ncbi:MULTISPECIES: CBS domain-containing protein [unclassified Haloparvum]|uniref:CBS domain-containing protein n=1 Tax=Haloparvum sp. PAK95 TaxID=3418962 RepID=UPI003D2F050B